MQYIPYVLMLLWSVLRGWASMPRAVWRFFRHGIRYRRTKSLPAFDSTIPGDKIHFINTGNSDAILLESTVQSAPGQPAQRRFALADAAEDSDYPAGKRFLAYAGYEDYVTEYVKRMAGGRLDFVLGTHAHSDHIGGFDTLILDPDVTIGRAYLKPYDGARMRGYERVYWDNEEVHSQMTAALAARGVPLIEDIPDEPFTLGNFRVTLFDPGPLRSGDANDSSIGMLIECGGKRAFLAGDVNNISGAERRLAKKVGPVDLLKAGHHGHEGSSTLAIVTGLRPETVIFARKGGASPTVAGRFICAGTAKRLLSTGVFGGIAAVFGGGGIQYYAINEFAEPIPPKSY